MSLNSKNIILLILASVVFIAFMFLINKTWASDYWDNGDYESQETICHCETPDEADPFQCQTITIGERAAESHLEEHENDFEGVCEEEISPTPTLEPEPTITLTPTETPIVVQTGGQGGGSGDDRSDGLGCSVKDCSGNKVEPPITLVPCSANNCGRK